jgi:hypothetical protein
MFNYRNGPKLYKDTHLSFLDSVVHDMLREQRKWRKLKLPKIVIYLYSGQKGKEKWW